MSYGSQVNPFSLEPPVRLANNLKSRRIQLVVIKDDRLKALVTAQTKFRMIDQVRGFSFYHAPQDECFPDAVHSGGLIDGKL